MPAENKETGQEEEEEAENNHGNQSPVCDARTVCHDDIVYPGLPTGQRQGTHLRRHTRQEKTKQKQKHATLLFFIYVKQHAVSPATAQPFLAKIPAVTKVYSKSRGNGKKMK